MARVLSVIGLAAVVYLVSSIPRVDRGRVNHEDCVRFLALGDVNLGRETGQKILKGDTLYPFAFVRDTLAAFDLVFANLECTLSDQNGETQSPKNNLIFTGPPAGAATLQKAGIHVVSTANNHALDYGIGANHETAAYLSRAGVAFAGTASINRGLYEPVLVVRKGIRFAFFACTDVMNITDTLWRRYVAPADTSAMLPRIRAMRDSADFIVVSYHGGNEYAEMPTSRTIAFTRAVINAGADIVLGHHPHVAHGIEQIDGKFIVYSLGNFAFHQPQRFWTQRSFAFAADIVKDRTGTRVRQFRCLPLLADWQPKFLQAGEEADRILERVHRYSFTDNVGTPTW